MTDKLSADLAAVWMSTPNHMFLEIARDIGYRQFVLDVEHGLFDIERTDRLVAFAKALDLKIYAKVAAPDGTAIQQMLDMGCAGVIIPHIGNLAHAREVTAAAKYPPVGTRSFAGTRTSSYLGGSQGYYLSENERVRCYPMVETAEALADIEAILALPAVDGVFMGPTDLSLSRGRGAYRNTAEDKADLSRVIEAAKAAGKPWIMPAWSLAEQREAIARKAGMIVISEEVGALQAGLASALKEFRLVASGAGQN